MSWWDDERERQTIVDFKDRNRVNQGITSLEKIADNLRYCAELIYQTGRGARKMVARMASSKTLSSYPDVIDILNEADKIALDAPNKFADYCNVAAKHLADISEDLKQKRDEFVNETLPNKLKGLAEDA